MGTKTKIAIGIIIIGFLCLTILLVLVREVSTTPCWVVDLIGFNYNSSEIWNKLNECRLISP